MKKVVLFPLYILSIFSEAKSFKTNPVIGNKVLNILGLHVFRTVLSHAIFKLRQFPLSFVISKEDKKAFRENGFILKENFVDSALFENIVKEVRAYNGMARQCVQGDTITWRVFLDEAAIKQFPETAKLLNNCDYLSLLKYGAAKNEIPLFYIQQIRNGVIDQTRPDPQKTLHSDTFHPTMKAWLFLEDVTHDMGPFTYVPGSQKLSLKRLAWEYKKSIIGKNLNDGYSEKGSMRLTEEERKQLGFNDAKGFAVKANTLVMANTNGFHARGNVNGKNITRLEIWAYSRPNPFNPWVGLGTKFYANLRNNIFNKYLKRCDEKAAKRNAKSSWHVVEGGVV